MGPENKHFIQIGVKRNAINFITNIAANLSFFILNCRFLSTFIPVAKWLLEIDDLKLFTKVSSI